MPQKARRVTGNVLCNDFLRFAGAALVAAGVILCGDQKQSRPGGFRLRVSSEHRKDAENRHVRGKDAETDRGDDCEAEDERHH